jgi:threonine dehydrogenase-like Zn-dependent dehydrogenase
MALRAIGSGLIDVKVLRSLITHNFEFDQVQEAFETAKNNKSQVIKAMLTL